MTATNTSPATPYKSIPLDRLGYRRLKTAEMRELEYSTAVAFLGEDHVLFTFDPHTLINREKADQTADHPHMVRAVLLNLATGRTERTLEWRIRDDAQYLWEVDGEHILVHDGDYLRWFGNNLRQEHEIKLDGPLAFLRMSPDRNHYAIGVVHELHSRDDHAGLVRADAVAPEEQVKVTLLDANLKTEDEGMASSRAMPPMLLDTGRIELRRARDNSYYLREFSWTPGSEPKDFARLESACVPTIKSLSGNLLLAEGCDHNPNDHWLLAFHENGAPVLKSLVHWREFSPLIAGNAESGTFAMAICEGGNDYVRSTPFHSTDLLHETVRVHRISDGREVFSTRMRFPLPSSQPISFAPSGKHLAIVDGDAINIYSLSTPELTHAQSPSN